MASNVSSISLNLRATLRHDILSVPKDGAFDTLCELVRRLLDCKAAVVHVVDRDGMFSRSRPQEGGPEQTHDLSLCASAVVRDDSWAADGATIDPRTLVNPLIAGSLGLRFYAGIPLRTADGHDVGVLAALDTAPRRLSETELDSLKLFARAVVDMLELRLAAWATIMQAGVTARP